MLLNVAMASIEGQLGSLSDKQDVLISMVSSLGARHDRGIQEILAAVGQLAEAELSCKLHKVQALYTKLLTKSGE